MLLFPIILAFLFYWMIEKVKNDIWTDIVPEFILTMVLISFLTWYIIKYY